MGNELINTARKAVKYWWVSLIIGALAIILGIWSIAAPASTLFILSALFVASFLVGGIGEIIFALANKEILSGWGWTLASGIINIIFAFILIAIPWSSILVLIFYIGFLIMFQSISGISSAVELQKMGSKDWGWLLALAILGFILSFILIVNPAFASGFIVTLFSITLFCYGIFRIYLGFKLKTIKNEFEEVDKKLNEQ